jgi:hypothetical protein
MLRLASRFRAFHRGGSYVHLALGKELDLDSRRRGLRFSGSTHAASRDEAAMITKTVSR